MKTIKYLVISIIFSMIILIELYIQDVINIHGLIILLITMALVHAAISFHFYQLIKQFSHFNHVIESIINGEMDAKVTSNDYIHDKKLNANIARLSKRITKMTYKNEEDEQTIKNLTNNITSPIIYIDRDGKIRYVNDQFLNDFQSLVEVNDIYEKLRVRAVYKFIDEAFILESKKNTTMQIKDKFYQANAIPINNQFNGQELFIGILFIFHDITELKKYEKLQREFLADASHELKTPISAIKGASEILLNGEKHTDETVNDFLSIIKNENERMEHIVSDILLISRIEFDNILVRMEKVDLRAVINNAIHIVLFKAEVKNQMIHQEIKEGLFIRGDYERLKHAFLNLITNAINYTNENKSIFIKAYHQDNQVIVTIKDEGIGIDEQALPHIFERFYRVDKARSRDTGGTGLGLAIVKSTMDLHKAKINVKSELNKGTEFIITFNEYK